MDKFTRFLLVTLKLLCVCVIVVVAGVFISDEIKIPLANQLMPYPVEVNFNGDVPQDQARSIAERLKSAVSEVISPESVLEGTCRQSPWCSGMDFNLGLYPKQLTLTVHASIPEFVVDYGHDRWLVSDKGELIQTVSSIQDPSISIAAADLPLIQFSKRNLSAGAVATASSCARSIIAAASSGVHFEQFLVEGDSGLRAISSGSEFPPIQVDCRKADLLKEQIARAIRVSKDLQARGEVSQTLDLRTQNQIIVK